jgi:folate-binding protein YgfZ
VTHSIPGKKTKMTIPWLTFLTQQSARVEDDHVVDFGDASAELQAAVNGNVISDLSHLALLQLEGADAVTFLQGQVTNDVKLLDGSTSHYAGYCNPKGRMLAMFFAFAHGDHLHLQLPKALAEPITKRLRMYVLRSKVTISDVSNDIVRLGIAGPDSEAALARLFNKVPQNIHEVITLENGVIIRMPGPASRFQVYCKAQHAESLWKALVQSHKPVGKNVWDWLEIQAGIPDVLPGTQEEFVPQMLNLDALGGINFKKGCYTGQEIVARTHYLGKVKRRTQIAHVACERQPSAGEDILVAGGSESAGKIVRSAAAPEGGFDVLAEVRLENLAVDQLAVQGQALAFKPLPYGLPDKA